MFHIENKYIYKLMIVILKDIVPPIIEVSKLGYAGSLFTVFYSNLPFKTGDMKKVNMSIGVIVE